MMLSFIYPIYNRADLFAVTLDSFVLRTVAWHLLNDRAFTGSRVRMTAVAA